MKVIVQRTKGAKVLLNNEVINEINEGLVLLVGFTHTDTKEEVNSMIKKIINLRIFNDENGIMNLSIKDIKGMILSLSQFTLYADTKKGNRPSYTNAMDHNLASNLFDYFNEELNKYINTKSGIFGEDLQIDFINDGPVTIILQKENV